MIKNKSKLFWIYMLLGLGFATVMGFIYMQYTYYDAMLKTMSITNAQLGFLITIEAITGIITAIPGGILVDKFDSRSVVTVSLGLIMVCLGVFAIFPSYTVAMGVWGIASIIMSAWYSAIYKVVRVMAPKDGIGKSYGLFGIGCAVGGLIINGIGLALYKQFEKNSPRAGLSAILWVFFVCGVISCVGTYLLMRNMEVHEEEAAKYNWREFVRTLKNPGVWLFVASCFLIYSFHVSVSYFTPYFTSVLGTTVVFSGIISTLRQSEKVVSSPLGGWLGDKMHSTSKILRIAMCVLGVFVVIVLMLQKNTPLALLVALVFAIGFFDEMTISLQASVSADALVPSSQMGVAVGLTSVFTADLFQDTMFGSWLDKFGNVGYTYIWIYTLCIAVASIAVLSAIVIRKRKHFADAMKTEVPAKPEVSL